MVSKTLKRIQKRKIQAEAAKEGVLPEKFTEKTKGHMAHGKLVKMPHHLKRKHKYRIGTATAHDIYEGFENPLGDVKCSSAKAALAEAAKRKEKNGPTKTIDLIKKPNQGAVLKKKKVVKKVTKKASA